VIDKKTPKKRSKRKKREEIRSSHQPQPVETLRKPNHTSDRQTLTNPVPPPTSKPTNHPHGLTSSSYRTIPSHKNHQSVMSYRTDPGLV